MMYHPHFCKIHTQAEVSNFTKQTINFVSIDHSYYSNCKIIWTHIPLNQSLNVFMCIVTHEKAVFSRAGLADGKIFPARVVGAVDTITASVFVTNAASYLR